MAQMTKKKAGLVKAGAFTKRIGYTVYNVGVYYNENAKETAQDKIIRLIKNEATGKGAKKL